MLASALDLLRSQTPRGPPAGHLERLTDDIRDFLYCALNPPSVDEVIVVETHPDPSLVINWGVIPQVIKVSQSPR